MASGEAVRKAMLQAVKQMDQLEKKSAAQLVLLVPSSKRKSAFISFETRLINSFHHGDTIQNQIAIAKFVTAEANCQGVVILRVLENGLFRIYFRGNNPCASPDTYDLEDFRCVQEVTKSKRETVQTDEDIQALSLLVEWKPLFTFIPDVVVSIPILQLDQQVMAVVAISFKQKIPPDFLAHKLNDLKEILEAVTPYAMMLQATRDFEEDTQRMQIIINSMDVISNERNKRNPESCAKAIANEFVKITSCPSVSVYQLDIADKHFLKVYTTGRKKHPMRGCPNPDCHENDYFPYNDKEPLTWVATNRKVLKLNDPSDCVDINLPKKSIHSAQNCFCKNVLLIPIYDHSGEKNIVIELTDKKDGFTKKDYEVSALLAQNASSIYSCAVMLTHRDKTYRRNSMLNRILLNIEPIKHMKVEQLLSQLRKIIPANEFEGAFVRFDFNIKNYPDWKMIGGILHAFTDLDLINTFKIRRTTLIRFILSTQQGYRPLPYHNWHHACSVAHFGYSLIKNLNLLQDGYMKPLEAFALIISGLAHDIDHRGTNNRFQSCTNSDLFQLYNTQESIMERHHLAIALSIIRREDCNILENLTPDDYKEFIELLTWNILATDIAKYLQTRDSNFKALRSLRKQDKEDKLALFSLMMTASDVNDCVKSWDDNLASVKHILTEFFDQGDLEKEMGMSPLPMMDRTQAYIPEVEYKFISGIVLPAYKELANKFSPLRPCVETLERYKDNWEYSSVIFDAHKDIVDQLSILNMSEMKEENLRNIGAKNHEIRKFSSAKPNIERRGTVLMSRAFSIRSMLPPEAEFRMMFSDKNADPTDLIEREIDIDDGTKCCGCFKKK